MSMLSRVRYSLVSNKSWWYNQSKIWRKIFEVKILNWEEDCEEISNICGPSNHWWISMFMNDMTETFEKFTFKDFWINLKFFKILLIILYLKFSCDFLQQETYKVTRMKVHSISIPLWNIVLSVAVLHPTEVSYENWVVPWIPQSWTEWDFRFYYGFEYSTLVFSSGDLSSLKSIENQYKISHP